MLKFNRVGVVAAAALLSTAAWSDTMTMDVKAVVTGTCKMVAANALDFGTLDPVTALAVTGKTTTIQYLCTKGKTPTSLTIDGNGTGSYSGAMVHATVLADTIAFGLTWGTSLPAGKGMGTGNEVSVTVTGGIAANAYANVTAGNYLVQLPVTLTP